MIYSSKIQDKQLLEGEFKKLKKLYSEALNKDKTFLNVTDLRKRIKLITAKLSTCNHPITDSNNNKGNL